MPVRASPLRAIQLHWTTRPSPAALQPEPPPAGRDLRLDTLRGWMLIAMAINHLDTELRVLTDYPFGFVTTAEGFVFLSGLVAGLVYVRRSVSQSPAELSRRARARAGEIYRSHLIAYLVVLVGMRLPVLLGRAASWASPALFTAHPIIAALLGAALLYQPGLLDILPMYCIFMLALPLLLAGFQKGRWAWVFAASAGLWLLAQTGLHERVEIRLSAYIPVNLGVFDPLAWQLLFVGGAFFGWHWARSSRPLLSFRPAMLLLCLLVAVPLWFLLKYQHPPTGVSMDQVWAWADKTHISPLRLVNFIVLAYLIAAVAVHRPRVFTFRPLAFLGQHSLIVFTVQAMACALLGSQPFFSASFAHRTFTALGLCALLFITAWLHQTFISRRSAAGSPAG
jgi:hypothetical protein